MSDETEVSGHEAKAVLMAALFIGICCAVSLPFAKGIIKLMADCLKITEDKKRAMLELLRLADPEEETNTGEHPYCLC